LYKFTLAVTVTAANILLVIKMSMRDLQHGDISIIYKCVLVSVDRVFNFSPCLWRVELQRHQIKFIWLYYTTILPYLHQAGNDAITRAGLTVVPWQRSPAVRGPPRQVHVFFAY